MIYRSNRCAAILPLHQYVSRSSNKSDPSVGAIGRKRDNILERHGASQCKLRRAVSGSEYHRWWFEEEGKESSVVTTINVMVAAKGA
jgi:hypothetical protein